MMDWNTNIVAPLSVTDDGTMRITGTRVSLDSIIHHFKLGATAEEIVCKFPSLRLADVYAVIAYYLNKREVVESYLHQQETDADAIQQQIESAPDYQATKAELRKRLLARWTAQ
jgi:uncharacterized protein (DUF433 family)